MTKQRDARDYEELRLRRRQTEALERLAEAAEQIVRALGPVTVVRTKEIICGARAEGGPCVLLPGHNMGNLDIPSNHSSSPRPQRVQVQVDEDDREPAQRPPVEPMTADDV